MLLVIRITLIAFYFQGHCKTYHLPALKDHTNKISKPHISLQQLELQRMSSAGKIMTFL